MIAVDPDVIPLYSIVDTGSAIQGEIIDLLVTDKETAYTWGRRKVKVRVIE